MIPARWRPLLSIARRATPHARSSRQRNLHLAPPFLLDDYTPRYQLLSERDAALKRSRAYAHLRNCNLCPRLCGVNRYETTGMCLIGEKAKVNVIAPHFGEGKFLVCRSGLLALWWWWWLSGRENKNKG